MFKYLVKKSYLYYFLIFLYSLFVFYKLTYNFVFTDEILYLEEGKKAVNGIFDNSLQTPFLTKYLAGIFYLLFDHNEFWLRFPFALIFISSLIPLYQLLKRVFNEDFAFFGSLLYFTSLIVFESNRMVMLEPMMHLFWILFLKFYYETFFNNSRSNFIWSGIFLGLALAVKFTSVVLIAFVLIGFFYQLLNNPKNKKTLTINYLYLIGVNFLSFLLTYLHFFSALGIKNGLREVYSFFMSTYVKRNEEGKNQLIAGALYTKSPYWSYVYFSWIKDGIFRTCASLFALFSFFKVDFNLIFFGTVFILTFVLFEALGIKSDRYISTLWISLVFLIIIGIKKIIPQKFLPLFLTSVIFSCSFNFFYYLATLQPTKYNFIYSYFSKLTNNFSDSNKRVWFYGSVRSLNWYRNFISDSNLNNYLVRRDFEIMCPDFKDFHYFVFDKEQLKRDDASNQMEDFVKTNPDSFEVNLDNSDFISYERKPDTVVNLNCIQK